MKDSHKAFADEYLINGFNGTQAYKKVYQDASDEAAASNANRLLRNDKVIEYIEEEKKKLKKKARMSKEDKLDFLETMMKTCKRDTDKLKALEIHNKMTGDNEPDKVQHEGGIQVIYNSPT